MASHDDAQLRDQLTHWVGEQSIPWVKIKIGESWGGAPARDLMRNDSRNRSHPTTWMDCVTSAYRTTDPYLQRLLEPLRRHAHEASVT